MKSLLRLGAAVAIAALFGAGEAEAFRMIHNPNPGRTSSGYLVTCNDSRGFVHWANSNIPWRHNTANQGAGKATALTNALNSWTNVGGASHNLSYAGTTNAGFSTDGLNTLLWARGNGCNGSCLAITALVLASGQVITETDISFNQRYSWNTNGSNYDVEAIAAHELGHSLGLHHTEVTSTPRPTMYAYYFGTDGRSLHSDDASGLQCAQNRYPPAAAQFALHETGEPLSARSSAVRLAARPRAGGAILRYALSSESDVRLDVFDVSGRLVGRVVEGARGVGEHEIVWDGSGPAGRVPSGVYFARLLAGAQKATATVILAE